MDRFAAKMLTVPEERIELGVHLDKLFSVLPVYQTRRVVRAANTAGLDADLRIRPLGRVEIVTDLKTVGSGLLGLYDEDGRAILVSALRPGSTFARPFEPGRSSTVSTLAPTVLDAVRRSFVHEPGHHILVESVATTRLESQVRAAFSRGTPITRRASQDWREYFCECFSAHSFER